MVHRTERSHSALSLRQNPHLPPHTVPQTARPRPGPCVGGAAPHTDSGLCWNMVATSSKMVTNIALLRMEWNTVPVIIAQTVAGLDYGLVLPAQISCLAEDPGNDCLGSTQAGTERQVPQGAEQYIA